METTTVRDLCVSEEFAKFEAENGPSFAWGKLYSPYDGCHFLNVVAFIRNGYAYLASDLKSFPSYAGHVVEPPAGKGKIGHEVIDFKKSKHLRAGCIPADELRDVLSNVEFHPITELEANTPYQLYGEILKMASLLGIDVSGQLQCKLCSHSFDAGEELFYFEGDFRGNGGIGIEVGQPVCMDCYSENTCGYCGQEVPLEHQGLGEEREHCIYCMKDAFCSECNEDIDLSWGKDEEVKAFRELGVCAECYETVKERKEKEARDARAAALMGDLFEYAKKQKRARKGRKA